MRTGWIGVPGEERGAGQRLEEWRDTRETGGQWREQRERKSPGLSLLELCWTRHKFTRLLEHCPPSLHPTCASESAILFQLRAQTWAAGRRWTCYIPITDTPISSCPNAHERLYYYVFHYVDTPRHLHGTTYVNDMSHALSQYCTLAVPVPTNTSARCARTRRMEKTGRQTER